MSEAIMLPAILKTKHTEYQGIVSISTYTKQYDKRTKTRHEQHRVPVKADMYPRFTARKTKNMSKYRLIGYPVTDAKMSKKQTKD